MFWKDAEISFPTFFQLQCEGPKAHIQTIHSIKAAQTLNDIPEASKEKK